MPFHVLNEQKSPDISDMLVQGLHTLVGHKLHKNQLEHKLRFLKSQGLNEEQALHGAHLPEEHFGTLLKGIQDYRTGVPAERKLSPGEVEEEKLLARKNVQELENREQAQRKIPILKKMRELAESGKLNSPAFYKLAQRFGLQTPESDQFQKLSEQLIPPTKNEQELRSEQAKVPRLGQTKEGVLRIIDDLENENLKLLGKSPLVDDEIELFKSKNPKDGKYRVNEDNGNIEYFHNGKWKIVKSSMKV